MTITLPTTYITSYTYPITVTLSGTTIVIYSITNKATLSVTNSLTETAVVAITCTATAQTTTITTTASGGVMRMVTGTTDSSTTNDNSTYLMLGFIGGVIPILLIGNMRIKQLKRTPPQPKLSIESETQ